MTIHKLKIKQEYWNQVMFGRKTFELRKDDRGYEVGDLIQFEVINDDWQGTYESGLIFKITYILRDVPQYGLAKDYCILSIVPLVEKNKYTY